MKALAKACDDLGLEFKEGQITHKWFGKWVADYSANDAAYKQGVRTEDYGKCLHAIGVKGKPNAYEVGVIKNTSGKGWQLVWDNFAGGHGLMKVIGKDGCRLVGKYSEHASRRAMQKQGYQVSTRKLKDGTIQLTGIRA